MHGLRAVSRSHCHVHAWTRMYGHARGKVWGWGGASFPSHLRRGGRATRAAIGLRQRQGKGWRCPRGPGASSDLSCGGGSALHDAAQAGLQATYTRALILIASANELGRSAEWYPSVSEAIRAPTGCNQRWPMEGKGWKRRDTSGAPPGTSTGTGRGQRVHDAAQPAAHTDVYDMQYSNVDTPVHTFTGDRPTRACAVSHERSVARNRKP